MQNLRNKLIAGGAVMILVAIGTVMNRQAMQAAGGPSVTIESPIPLPVTGAVAVTQSGTWNVGLTGTPNVNVANPATAPALFLNVNDPGRIPYQSTLAASFCQLARCQATFTAVPALHRLVIQHFSGFAEFSALPSGASAVLSTLPLSFFNAFILPTPVPAANGFEVDFDQPAQLYYDAGQQPVATVNAGFIASAEFTVIGYMLDCTVAPCAAIAH
jgi:hypothetical protein